MCRGKVPYCTELGSDPSAWSRAAPLVPPSWFDEQLDWFAEAVRYIAIGDRARGLSVLRSIKSEQLRWWFSEHGQQSGYHRNKMLAVPVPAYSGPIDKQLKPSVENQVFERDHYHCRYCESRTVAKAVLKALERNVGIAEFCCSRNDNTNDHGAVLAFKVVADHVFHESWEVELTSTTS